MLIREEELQSVYEELKEAHESHDIKTIEDLRGSEPEDLVLFVKALVMINPNLEELTGYPEINHMVDAIREGAGFTDVSRRLGRSYGYVRHRYIQMVRSYVDKMSKEMEPNAWEHISPDSIPKITYRTLVSQGVRTYSDLVSMYAKEIRVTGISRQAHIALRKDLILHTSPDKLQEVYNRIVGMGDCGQTRHLWYDTITDLGFHVEKYAIDSLPADVRELARRSGIARIEDVREWLCNHGKTFTGVYPDYFALICIWFDSLGSHEALDENVAIVEATCKNPTVILWLHNAITFR